MHISKGFLHIRCLLLFIIIGLTATAFPAQTIVENSDESQNIEETKDNKTVEPNKAAQPEKTPRFGGHAGIVIPIVTRGNDTTTTIAEDFIIGFPVALVVKTDSPVAFDFEFVPTINTPSNQDFRFLIHPGVVYAFNKNYLVGVRGAYEVGTGNYGFTPIAQRSFKLTKKTRYFVEADFPVRWERRPNRTRFASIQFAIHSGISF